MKSLKFILILLLFNKTYSQQNAFSPGDLNSYVKVFEGFHKTLDLDISDINNQTIDISFANTRELYKMKGVIAAAEGMHNDSIIKIRVDREQFLMLDVNKKVSTIIHELCHDYYNAEHDDSHPTNLMHSTNLPETLEELISQFGTFLAEYRKEEIEARIGPYRKVKPKYYRYNGVKYTRQQIEDAAKGSNMSLDKYVKLAKIEIVY